MKSVLISIQPNPCALIVSGKKTIEVRRTRPKLETPFRCLIYETLGKTKWGHIEIPEEVVRRSFQIRTSEGRGKVIGEFVCDKISKIWFSPRPHGEYVSDIENLYKASCLNFDEMFSYFGEGGGYGWHISDLKIYDKPRELSEFAVADKDAIRQCENREQAYYAFTDTGYIKNGFYCKEKDDWCFGGCKRKALTRPPQSYMFVEEVKQ